MTPFKTLILLLCVSGFLGLSSLSGADEAPAAEDPLPLAGLWALSVGGDFSYNPDFDLKNFYPAGGVIGPGPRVFNGIDLSLRWHFHEKFFAGLGVSTLSKIYDVQVGGSKSSFAFDAVYTHLQLGWIWLERPTYYSYLQGEAGLATLNQATYLSSTGNPLDDGNLEGSGFATAFGVGGVLFLIPSVGVKLEGGYRNALITPVNFVKSGSLQSPPSGSKDFFVEDSGPYARLSLDFFWGVKNPWGTYGPSPEPPAPMDAVIPEDEPKP